MITDNQVKKLRMVFMNPKINVEEAASKVNICEKTGEVSNVNSRPEKYFDCLQIQ